MSKARMRAYRNGRLYSSGNLADLCWSFPQMPAYASRGNGPGKQGESAMS